MYRTSSTLLACAILAVLFPLGNAYATALSDLPAGPIADAVNYLQNRGMISGYADGTFRPDAPVNRAEALKLIMGPLLTKETLAKMTSTSFNDVKAEDWYLPYVEVARQSGVIEGPPKRPAFQGSKTVLKSEFIKMLLLAYRTDPNAYGEIRLPLANDVQDSTAWFYPYLRYAITASVTNVNASGNLAPLKELTRGECALFVARYLRYRAGDRTDTLLTQVREEDGQALSLLETNLASAELASARALLSGRGALASNPDDAKAQGVLKLAESVRSLVRGKRAFANAAWDEAVRLAGEAWNLAGRAQSTASSVGDLTQAVQTQSKKLAEDARAAKSPTP